MKYITKDRFFELAKPAEHELYNKTSDSSIPNSNPKH